MSPAGAAEPPPPIADYGLLGDTRTAALVSSAGAIDWMCVPRFDGPPLFGRLVGGPAAGTYRIGPARAAEPVERRYRRDTTTLRTTWAIGGRRLTLTEGMVAEVTGRLLPTTLLVRRLQAEEAPPTPSSSSILGSVPATGRPGYAGTGRSPSASGMRSRCR
ncbi:trehalase-like domain-containing protein [Plantactinospora veratri]